MRSADEKARKALLTLLDCILSSNNFQELKCKVSTKMVELWFKELTQRK